MKAGDPILSQRCSPLLVNDDMSFVDDMKDTLSNTKEGTNLSASQIGVTKRVIVTYHDRKKIRVMINPVIMETSNTLLAGFEECLSYPDHQATVMRYISVKVRYEDEQWRRKVRVFEGKMARAFFHALDHTWGHCGVIEAWEKSTAV